MPSHPVALSEFDTSLPALLLAHLALDDLLVLVVVVLELSRGMYLQVSIGPCTRVAEGVVDTSWLEDERASRGEHDLPSDIEGQLALQDEVALVLAGVGVRRDHLARREACLDDRKRAAEILRCHFVGYVQDGEVDTFIRADEVLLLVGCHGGLPFTSGTYRDYRTLEARPVARIGVGPELYELPRIPIPRTRVNKPPSGARDSPWWHHNYDWCGGAVTDRYCRNCGHELAETDRFCPNCGTPVHEAAHVPTP